MALDWKAAFEKLVTAAGGKLPTAATAKDEAFKLIEKWLGDDRKAIADLLRSILADGKLDQSDAIGIVSALAKQWAAKSPFSASFTTRLLETLKDGQLTAGEVAAAAAGWLADRTDNKNVKQFIAEIADGSLSRDEARDLLLSFVSDQLGAAKAEALQQLMTGKVLPSEVLLVIATLRQSDLREGGKDVNPGDTLQKHLNTLIGYLKVKQGDAPSQVIRQALDKLVEGDNSGLASVLVGAVVKGDDLAALLSKELAARLKERLQTALVGQLGKIEGISKAQASQLAVMLQELLSGKRSLWAKSDEEQFAEECPKRLYPLWMRLRNVLVAARWAINGGAVVSTDALARPHVFAAADIQPNTELRSLVAPAKANEFAHCIKAFCAAEFATDPGGTALGNPLNFQLDAQAIQGTAGAKPAQAKKVLYYVDGLLTPGVPV